MAQVENSRGFTKPIGQTPASPSCIASFSFPSQLTMDLILSQNINSELMPNACSMLYVLICCYQVKYTFAMLKLV